MSRRQLTLVVVTLFSLVATACGTASTAPRHEDADSTASIVTNGSGG